MELTNAFEVGVPIDLAWSTLTDIERIAPCMPGAELKEVEGDEYHGLVKVKVGPIIAEYRGKATFVELDEARRIAVLRAEGRESRGQGNAKAIITATLEARERSTKVNLSTDLTITGKVAQFGRGVLSDVSTKLLGLFVESLETTVLSQAGVGVSPELSPEVSSEPVAVEGSDQSPDQGGDSPVVPAAPDTSPGLSPSQRPGVRIVEGPDAAPVDLVALSGGSLAKRAAPVLCGVAVITLVWMLGRRLRR